ncbi:uncharacterized protein LOC120328852 [Styela clava]
MDTSTDQDQENSIKFIRKLRKKLRQIERLEKTQRELTDEEKIKLSCKHDIRSKLQLILSTINELNISFESNNHENEDEDDHDVIINHEKDEPQPEVKSVSQPIISVDNEKSEKVILEEAAPPEQNKNEAKVEKESFDKGKKVQNVRSCLRRFWRNSTFEVTELKGHNDSVNCVDAMDNWIVSGSRDTSLKLWDSTSGKILRSMGGHTGQVTAVKILTIHETDELRRSIDRSTIEIFADIDEKQSKDEKIVISGSTDCSIRLWLLPQGLFIKSIYNYNPVSTILYMPEKNCVVVGSSSGNLTVYNICSNLQVYSSTIHKNRITKIKCNGNHLFTSCDDGSLKVWKIEVVDAEPTQTKRSKFDDLDFNIKSDEFDITLKYSFDNHDSYICDRSIHSFLVHDNLLYFGDDGSNIKVWNPRSDVLSKLRNHKTNVPGITDAICVLNNDVLISTSYDLDSGHGSLNIRSLHPECNGAYIGSFNHENIARLSTFISNFTGDIKYLVTGGEKLLLWKFYEPGKQLESVGSDENASSIKIRGQNITELTKPATDSDVLSEDESSGGEDEGKWFWQWSKPKTDKSRKLSDSNQSDTHSESDASRHWKDETTMNVSSYSFWDWCSVV